MPTSRPTPTNPVNQAEIQMLQGWVNAGQIEQAYDYLADRGYAYASLASGVAGADTPGGVFALSFLQTTTTHSGFRVGHDSLKTPSVNQPV